MGNGLGTRTQRSKGAPCRERTSGGKHVRGTDQETNMSPELLKVAERAKRDPDARFNSLAHLLDEAALERAYHRIRKDAADRYLQHGGQDRAGCAA